MSIYTNRLLSYWDQNLQGWRHPKEDYTHAASDINTLCGDEVEYRLIVVDGILKAVDFWAAGCSVVQCCAAMLAKLAREKSVEWVRNYTAKEWDAYVNIPIGESRKKSCMMLPLITLKQACRNEPRESQ